MLTSGSGLNLPGRRGTRAPSARRTQRLCRYLAHCNLNQSKINDRPNAGQIRRPPDQRPKIHRPPGPPQGKAASSAAATPIPLASRPPKTSPHKT
jgi:hypothetical protein